MASRRATREVFAQAGIQVRAESQDGGQRIVGYAAVFDQPTELWPGYLEVVRRGAFTKTLKEGDARALWNHDPSMVLGRVSAGTLKLAEDDHGLRYEIAPPDTTFGRDALVMIGRGDVRESSFGFSTVRDKVTQDEKGVTLRELLELELFDASPVAFPAYPTTEVELRTRAAAVCVTLRRHGLTALADRVSVEAVQLLSGQTGQSQGDHPALRARLLENDARA